MGTERDTNTTVLFSSEGVKNPRVLLEDYTFFLPSCYLYCY
jgi:hypothetical protein